MENYLLSYQRKQLIKILSSSLPKIGGFFFKAWFHKWLSEKNYKVTLP